MNQWNLGKEGWGQSKIKTSRKNTASCGSQPAPKASSDLRWVVRALNSPLLSFFMERVASVGKAQLTSWSFPWYLSLPQSWLFSFLQSLLQGHLHSHSHRDYNHKGYLPDFGHGKQCQAYLVFLWSWMENSINLQLLHSSYLWTQHYMNNIKIWDQ